jgi:hypothetical protein
MSSSRYTYGVYSSGKSDPREGISLKPKICEYELCLLGGFVGTADLGVQEGLKRGFRDDVRTNPALCGEDLDTSRERSVNQHVQVSLLGFRLRYDVCVAHNLSMQR